MAVWTVIFVLLYMVALSGWSKAYSDEILVARLEPVIFVVIGYYFGRIASQQTEGMLRGEIVRQTQRADAAHHAKEQIQQARESLEEKVKNVRAILAPAAADSRAGASPGHLTGAGAPADGCFAEHLISAAREILNS